MSSELDFERDKVVDHDALDIEWLRQPELIYNYSKALSDAEGELDDSKLDLEIAKNEVERIRGEIDLKIRANPEEYDIENLTEAAVKSAILQNNNFIDIQEKYRETIRELNSIKDDVSHCRSALKSIETRKPALEGLVKLLGLNYFAAPIEPRNLSHEVKNQKIKEDAKTKIRNQKQKRTRTK